MSPQKAEYYRRVLPLVLRNYNPIFSHADFQRKNVMIRNDGTLVIIDWETAGWYPSYWEYTLAMFTCGRWDDDWHIWVAKILDEYPNEYAWMDMLRRDDSREMERANSGQQCVFSSSLSKAQSDVHLKHDQPVILDDDSSDEAGAGDDEAEGAAGDVNTRRIKGDASLQNTFATSELASAPTESIDISNL